MELVRLGEICDLFTGGTPSKKKSEYFINGTIKWLVSGDINQREIFDCEGRINQEGMNNSNAKFLPKNSVLIALNGQGKTRGTVALLKTNATCNQSLVAISPKDNKIVESKFIFYVLDGMYSAIRKLTGDSGNDRRGLNMRIIRDIKIPLLPIQEQQRIVEKIDAAFLELDKLHLLIQSREIEIESLKSKVLSYLIKNQGKGERMKLKSIVSYIKKNAINSGLPYVGLENIQSNTMELIGDISIPDKTSSTFEFNENYVLYGRLRPYLKKVAVPEFKGQCSTEIFCIKPNNNLLKKFLAFWLIESSIAKRIELSSTGARMPRANMNQILNFEINIPLIDDQLQIIDKLEKTFELVKKLKSIHIKLEENLQSLKSKLLEEELASLN